MVNYDKENRRRRADAEVVKKARIETEQVKQESEKTKAVLTSTMHEVRRFSSEISLYAENLSKSLLAVPLQLEKAKELAENVFYAGGLLAARLGFTDIELNPDSIQTQPRLRAGIYKKFEKARYILLQRAKTKGVNFRFTGNSYFEIDALQSFELVPFVLLDNAVKYSPDNQVVEVNFLEAAQEIEVEIKSIGPTLESDEIATLFTRNGRGRNARKASIPGEGLGLYLAKVLCDIHKVRISANSQSGSSYQLGGIDYSTFSTKLRFKKHQ